MVTGVTVLGDLDFLLVKVAEAIQLPPSVDRQVRDSYTALTDFLLKSGLAAFSPDLYPQGSYRLGTTVRPVRHDEFDLDFVAQLNGADSASPPTVFNEVAKAFKTSSRYQDRVEIKERCIRITYADSFHVDIVPAIPDANTGGTAILIPAKVGHQWQWQSTNPRAYVQWFESRATRVWLELAAAAEPLPPAVDAAEKADLQVAVQLLKRYQDVHLIDEEVRTPSITITTIAGNASAGHSGLRAVFGAAVTSVCFHGRLSVPVHVDNPANPGENLGRKWQDEGVFDAYRQWTGQLAEDWLALSSGRVVGMHGVEVLLSAMFGEKPVREAFRALGNRIQSGGTTKTLVTVPSAMGALGIGVRGQPNPKKTFFGDD